MTSRIDTVNTDEFLRRRKLRIQQVREQSKDIAKKIRNRAKVEKLRHLEDINASKEKEYFECQNKLVKHLELLYSKGLQNVGVSHKKALEVDQEKSDLSKLRGKEAAAELKRRKQEKLDQQRKLLERKVQAREAANEISREKTTTVAKNLTKQKSEDLNSNISNKANLKNGDDKQDQSSEKYKEIVVKNDMGTQWESEELPNEWEPNVPTLSFPKDDSIKDSTNENVEKLDKTKRPNLFALSEEMPSSLRGGLTGVSEERPLTRPSLTLVTEYLQNRNLRLRESEPISSQKQDDLQSIKQTILRSRAPKSNGKVFDNVCHVLDEQVIPVPSWQAEIDSDLYGYKYNTYTKYPSNSQKSKIPFNKFCLSPSSLQMPTQSYPVQMQHSFCKGIKCLYESHNHKGSKVRSESADPDTAQNRKKSIAVYNHNTRSVKDIPCDDGRLVQRDEKSHDDAYAQALRETTSVNNLQHEQLNKIPETMRSKVAVTKHIVDKEYRDTLAFLNSLPKDSGNKPIKTAYMDGHQQEMQKEKYQRKLQQEFKRIERECNKPNCKHSKRKATILQKTRKRSKSPVNNDSIRRDFEYSWMPVPESDGNLAIHTIPNTNSKPGNSVTFSKADSYHEYRSRHKHTPPTKDVCDDKQSKKIVETVVLEQNSNESEINESIATSETSSVENLNLDTDKNHSINDSRFKDADRIIIYKILDSKRNRKSRVKKKVKINKAAQFERCLDEKRKSDVDKINSDEIANADSENVQKSINNLHRGVSIEQIQEGVYKAVNTNGDNITSLYFSEDPQESEVGKQGNTTVLSCCCSTRNANQDFHKSSEEKVRKKKIQFYCDCGINKNKEKSNLPQPSAATSTSSFTTAVNEKLNNVLPSKEHIKITKENDDPNNQFYIGASGFIKDENYEVIIQLRKKDAENLVSKPEVSTKARPDTISEKSSEAEELPDTILSNNTSVNKGDEQLNSSLNEPITLKTTEQTIIPELHVTNTAFPVQTTTNYPLNNKCEKAVLTSFQDSYVIPAHVTKSDTIPRPATSTYTQTSFNSPVSRPPFMHMSSSTSTAYMSPPELILPKFLKHNYVITGEEIYESENTMNQLDSHFDVIENENYNDVQHTCSCQRCRNKATRNKKIRRKCTSKTPPNTARSSSRDKSSYEYKDPRCRESRSRSATKICHKSHETRSKSIPKTKYSKDFSSHNLYEPISQTVKRKNNICTNSKENMNPLIANYVNRLLALNSEGLKAIEVINQDCSSVSTPGSSIINLPCNKGKKTTLEKKISLEQIKNIIKQHILDNEKIPLMKTKQNLRNTESQTEKIQNNSLKFPKKKSVHKVKSLNISKHILNKKKVSNLNSSNQRFKYSASTSSAKNERKYFRSEEYTSVNKTSKPSNNYDYKNNTNSDIVHKENTKSNTVFRSKNMFNSNTLNLKKFQQDHNFNLPLHRATTTSIYTDSETLGALTEDLNSPQIPLNTSTQTNKVVDAEINFMKLAEDKLQNMEKIADLTEKCTQRLSNLAKVLEEVRKNKSLAYNQMSTSSSVSDSDHKSDKNEISYEISSHVSAANNLKKDTIETCPPISTPEEKDNVSSKESSHFTQFLKDIPRPTIFTVPPNTSHSDESANEKPNEVRNMFIELESTKVRPRPPPALSRIQLKYGQDVFITPHELSTVIEVDSPMSVKMKNDVSEKSTANEMITEMNKTSAGNIAEVKVSQPRSLKENPDLLKKTFSRKKSKISSSDSSDDSKIRMMDLKQFNDIMLKPFVSLQDYVKQCNIGSDEGSNLDDVNRDEPFNDEISSLHSDGSLPDVIAELLKRNMISEPFKFDTGSNVNSTTLSSESNLSVLALSKVARDKKRLGFFLTNKENAESSETLSISSNPDLENAFQKLGMGWASSTLKKTKERLALSSSSNTSSSSMAKFKIKSFSHDLPNLETDSTSSLLDISNKRERKKSVPIGEKSKHAVQQTSLTNSMTVKEFLTNELAKKITFNTSSRRDAEEDFVSLYETKMPDALKNTNAQQEDDHSSTASVNRARTSTPVQIFRSQTYHSTSTSNTSNGLFSNADELSSVKITSTSVRNHSTSDKDDLTIPNYSLKTKKALSDCSKSD